MRRDFAEKLLRGSCFAMEEGKKDSKVVCVIAFAFVAITVYVFVFVTIFLSQGFGLNGRDVLTAAWLSLILEMAAVLVVGIFCCFWTCVFGRG